MSGEERAVDIAYQALGPDRAKQYREVRLEALQTYPECFGSRYEDQVGLERALCLTFPQNLYLFGSGILFGIHGLSHIITGLFPCDEDLGASQPSIRQKIHNVAGLVMYFSLLLACFLWVLAPGEVSGWFWWYTAGTLVFSVLFLIFMVKALETDHNLGLYQRLSYGALALWCAVLSLVARGTG